jgi:predicted Rossmann fold flavoprotein
MPGSARKFDVIVLGAGAAGLMCAAVAGQRGRRVLLLEHNGQPGRKILISGGGRCNFTNIYCGPGNFISENPHFGKSALALYQPRHFLELVERYGIAWHEKTLGQLFCDHSSRAILDMLLAECERAGVEICMNARGVQAESGASGFQVVSAVGEFAAETLVVATGGLSIPKMGATGLAYDLARQFGLKVIAPRPALVPLVLGGAEAGWTELTGVSTEAVAHADSGPRFREKMLFTHRGLSGPAVLQASSYWRPGQALTVDFAPGLAAGQELLSPLPRCVRRCESCCRRGWLYIWLRWAHRTAGPMRRLRHASAGCAGGNFSQSVRRDSKRLRLRRAAWTPTACNRARWKHGLFPGCSSSARRWM